jgi:hypothetical protein
MPYLDALGAIVSAGQIGVSVVLYQWDIILTSDSRSFNNDVLEPSWLSHQYTLPDPLDHTGVSPLQMPSRSFKSLQSISFKFMPL